VRSPKEDGDQKHRSRHHRAFLEPETGKMLLADNARRLRDGLFGQGVPAAALEDHLSVLGNPAALEAALAWYRANKGLAGDFGTIKVPTLYIWGDADATVGPDAAHGTGDSWAPPMPWKCSERRPFRHGSGAGQSHGADAGSHEEAPGVRRGAPCRPPGIALPRAPFTHWR
jgi:hypothetical protein